MHLVNAKGILSPKNGMNLYRGCSHGCIYCDSRSSCYHMAHAFADIEVKQNAMALLEDALRRKRKKCMISTGAMTDPYIPLEMQLSHMRQALRLIEKYGFGVTLLTKSNRVLRDLDLLKSIHEKTKCVVQMTMTTYDEDLCKKLEPQVCSTKARFEALKQLHAAGIPTIVWLCPILPFLNDTQENIAGILSYCAQAKVYGVMHFGMGLTLREGNREYFYAQLDRLFPQLKARYQRCYGNRYEVNSPRQAQLTRLFHDTCERYGLVHDNAALFSYLQTFVDKTGCEQLRLFQ